ncbi:AAA family ATPase [Natrinema pallidum DSM 3751]|uniref:AAA family ATPase n=2 Tax=Natrinema pallidum TaxID=69527 RepID=L9Z791_9EURY|nr:AAA family ATPase [Natrinema pallidum DSM 3751]
MLESTAERSREVDRPTVYYFSGEDGTGKDRLPGVLTEPEKPVLRADAAAIFEDDELITRLIREAALQEAAIHLEGVEAITGDEEGPTLDEEGGDLEITADEGGSVDTVVDRLDDAPGDVFLSHTDPWKPDVDLEHHRVETAHCPFPDYETRVAVWEEYRGEFAEEYLVTNLATNFRLPQRDIRRAVETARYLCRTEADSDALGDRDEPEAHEGDLFAPVDEALTREHCYAACKRYSASNLEALAEPMEPGYTFDDIYLNDKPKTHLRELCGHLQYRGQVTSEWGFGEPGDRGDGVVALFYGPPGTGKTMAAEVIANETGLDLYRVDLSQIVNKYIGETESRLAALLEEAERSNAILLFDEADSLFGERTDVGDSTDRYANNVTNFLLQRLESFDGVALLTTNKRSGIDPAFKRRIAHSVLFDVPQERIRRRIWKDVWPADATVDTDGFDYEFLGLFSITPAVIRKVAKYAAYIAATEAHDGHPLTDSATALDDITITFDHVVLGLQYANEAGGVAIEGDFFQYEDKLRTYENQTVGRDVETLFKLKYGLDDQSESETDAEARSPTDREPKATDDDDRTPSSEAEQEQASSAEQAAAEPASPSESPERTGDLEPEDVIWHFYDGIRTKDHEAIQALYHSDAAVEPLSYKEVVAKNINDASVAGRLRRTTDESAHVALEFDEESGSHRIPMTFELELDDGRWRIVSISHGTPVETDDEE